jgi:hypothetical protein
MSTCTSNYIFAIPFAKLSNIYKKHLCLIELRDFITQFSYIHLLSPFFFAIIGVSFGIIKAG